MMVRARTQRLKSTKKANWIGSLSAWASFCSPSCSLLGALCDEVLASRPNEKKGSRNPLPFAAFFSRVVMIVVKAQG